MHYLYAYLSVVTFGKDENYSLPSIDIVQIFKCIVFRDSFNQAPKKLCNGQRCSLFY